MSNYKQSILLVRNDRVGDLVLTLPAIEALRSYYPDAHLTALVSQYAGSLLIGHPAINELLVDDPASGAWKLARRLRQRKFDAAVVFNTSTRNNLAVRLAGIPRRVCWAYKPIGRLTATHPVRVHRNRPPIHEAAFAMAFVRQLGAPVPDNIDPPSLTADSAAQRRLAERLHKAIGTDGPLFGVHPGNKNSAYNWPVTHYAELVARLATRGRVIVTGSPEEQPLVDAVCQRTAPAHRNRVLALTDLKLQELVELIRQQNVLVVSSTGPMHLASAVGTPTVALFSPHPAHIPQKWAPLGNQHTVLVAPLAPGEDPKAPQPDGTALMARISVEQATAAAVPLVRDAKAERSAA